MSGTDTDSDLEFAGDEQLPVAPAIDARYAGVNWGLAESVEAAVEDGVEAARSS